MTANIHKDLLLHGKVIFTGKLILRSGLHIGGNKTTLEIGGIDNPVIKNPQGVPYIPGSSVKGKIRSLLEISNYPIRNENGGDDLGFFSPATKIHMFADASIDPIMRIFGAPDMGEPGRAIFRDVTLDLDHFDQMRATLFENLDLPYSEEKIENAIDRVSGEAKPRNLERVPMDAQFDIEIILDLYHPDDKALLITLFQGLRMLEDDYLGGSGTRGSGKVSFSQLALTFRNMEYYRTETSEIPLAHDFILSDVTADWLKNVAHKITL